jgi:D-hydroxyproline dehydrogenase subunit alpha
VFAAGEVTGVTGAGRAERQGYLAGRSAARYLGRVPPAGSEGLGEEGRRVEESRRVDEGPGPGFPLRPGWLGWLDGGTVVCRCRETRWAEVAAAVAAGAREAGAVTEATGAGAGYCQGRVCGPVLRYAVTAASGAAD